MSGTIICGIDESPAAREAIDVARDLSVRLGARLVLVHVAANESARRDGELLLAEMVVDRWPGRRVERRVACGSPSEVLASIADEERADLLVVGAARGHRLLSSAVLGSVATSLSRGAPCPVVVVPPGVGLRSRLALSRNSAELER
jgi:nucleotide-binding universal stress UspA family protein